MFVVLGVPDAEVAEFLGGALRERDAGRRSFSLAVWPRAMGARSRIDRRARIF